MNDVYSIVSFFIFASPIIAGGLGFLGIWFRDEFWKDELYDYNEK